MTDNPRPTRAEASDVYNAILDGTDAIMLSAESASGSYPVRSVEVMSEIASIAEKNATWRNILARQSSDNLAWLAMSAAANLREDMLHRNQQSHIGDFARLIKPKAIVTTSMSGHTPRYESPRSGRNTPILCMTPNATHSVEWRWSGV